MTCENRRPCMRCLNKGLADTCVDAPRKRKKYLMDLEDQKNLAAAKMMSSVSMGFENSIDKRDDSKKSQYSGQVPMRTMSENNTASDNGMTFKYQQQQQDVLPKNSSLFSFKSGADSSKPQNRKFSSSAVDLEYASLTKLIKDPILTSQLLTQFNESPSKAGNGISQDLLDSASLTRSNSSSTTPGGNTNTYDSMMTNINYPHMTQQKVLQTPKGFDLYGFYPQKDFTINQFFIGPISGLPEDKQYITYPDIYELVDAKRIRNNGSQISFAIGTNSEDDVIHSGSSSFSEWGLKYKEPHEIYTKVNQPFPYPSGFHLLLSYLKKRFFNDKKILVKLAKSMAEYRPSFTAQVMTLKEEDLIFMEQCFQRTLLEYTKYLTISGTPTIIWRRTGQISFVSPEFVMLTGWTANMLLSKITFVIELMDDDSVIKYFDLFSKIAYSDTKGAETSDCTLKNPVGDKLIPTKCIWTLKRDVFGIPMMIIGNFLPLIRD